jgi:hypothetical protein
MASVASHLIEEVTALAQRDSLEDAWEICADGTYFLNNLLRYTFCIWLHCWLGMTWYTWLLLSYHCGVGVTLIVHYCCEFFAINMDASLFICTKEEQRAVILVSGAEGVPCAKCLEGCQCSIGTVSCHSVCLQVDQEVQEWVHKL